MRADTSIAYTTSHVPGKDPFFVRTDTYNTTGNDTLIAAKQRTFPVWWSERSRMGEISLANGVCLRALNGSDGTAPTGSGSAPNGGSAPKGGTAIKNYGDAGMALSWALTMTGMAALLFG